MFCQNCGAKIKDDAVFCSSCGKRIGANPEVPLQADAPITNIVENRAENKMDDTSTKKSFSFVWKSYISLIWLFYRRKEQKLVLDDGHIEIYGSDIWGKVKLIKSIDYSNIEKVEVIKKPNASIVALLGAIFSTLLSGFIVVGSRELLVRAIGFLFACVLPCYERTNRKPLYMMIYETNGNKIKLKGEKDCFDTADLAMESINAIISRRGV